MHGRKEEGMHHRGHNYGMMCCYHEWRGCGLLTWTCGVCDLFDPIKPRGCWSHLTQQLARYLPALLLFTRNVFDQQLHLQVFYGAPDLLEGCSLSSAYQRWPTLPVKSTGRNTPFRLFLLNPTGVFLVVGRFSNNAQGVVPSLGVRSDTR